MSLSKPFLLLLLGGMLCAQQRSYMFHSGLPGTISDVVTEPAGSPSALPAGFVSPDVDPKAMAGWSLRHLNRNPRPGLNYEPVFFIRPMHVPPAPDGHDPIVPGDTDTRMDWEYRNMREILGQKEPGKVERMLHARVVAYLHSDGLAWVPPGHYMEGDVYNGAQVGSADVVSTWATAKILRSLSERYRHDRNDQDRQMARNVFLALRKLASWDTGRAYYPFGSGALKDGKWFKAQSPTAVLEPVVSYWEATNDPDALLFAQAVAEGLMADAELLPPDNNRILPDGEFHGHMHTTLHAVWGVAHLGADLKSSRYVGWAKRVYDYAAQFGPGTGWMQAALWDSPVRELSETCATADMASIASWIAMGGFPEYWDHVERILRNYLRPQQFFVTPEYEKLYREMNRSEPAEKVEAGLERMRDLQGAVLGGPGPNSWFNWIASPQQCGPYATPYGCMSMFGCCLAEGMRGIHTVWSGILQTEKGAVLINESLNRTSDWAEVVSSLPVQGRVDVKVRRAADFFLRPPSWAPRDQVIVLRNGKQVPSEWGGTAAAYLVAKGARPGDVLTMVYPLVEFRQTWGNWPSQPGLALNIRWKGNSVIGMTPEPKALPIDFAHLPPIPALPDDAGE